MKEEELMSARKVLMLRFKRVAGKRRGEERGDIKIDKEGCEERGGEKREDA